VQTRQTGAIELQPLQRPPRERQTAVVHLGEVGLREGHALHPQGVQQRGLKQLLLQDVFDGHLQKLAEHVDVGRPPAGLAGAALEVGGGPQWQRAGPHCGVPALLLV